MSKQKTLQQQLDKLNESMSLIEKSLTEKTDARWKLIQAIDKTHKPGIEKLEDQKRKLQEEIDGLSIKVKEQTLRSEWSQCLQTGEVNEHFLVTLKKMMEIDHYLNHRYFSDPFEKVEQKPGEMKSGIKVWHCQERKQNLYFAIHNGKLVGFSVRDIAEHPGDTTLPFSFVGDMEFVIVKPGSKPEYSINITFQEWMRLLKTIEDATQHEMEWTETVVGQLREATGLSYYSPSVPTKKMEEIRP